MQFKIQAFCNQCLIDYQPSVYGFLLDRIYIKRPRSSYITFFKKNIVVPACFPLDNT